MNRIFCRFERTLVFLAKIKLRQDNTKIMFETADVPNRFGTEAGEFDFCLPKRKF